MPIVTTKTLTADELLLVGSPYGRGQLWDGRFVPLPPSSGSTGFVSTRIAAALSTFVEAKALGWVTGANQGFLVRHNPDRVLCASVGFTSIARLRAIPARHFIPFAPNLAVEVLEPDGSRDDVLMKAGVWLGHGSDLAWVVEPTARRVTVARPGAPLEVLEGTAVAKADPAVPGFSMALANLFADVV